jgi:hypothetical protein
MGQPTTAERMVFYCLASSRDVLHSSVTHTVLPSSCTVTPQRVASAVTINSPHPPGCPTHRSCGRGGMQRNPSRMLMVISVLRRVSVIWGAQRACSSALSTNSLEISPALGARSGSSQSWQAATAADRAITHAPEKFGKLTWRCTTAGGASTRRRAARWSPVRGTRSSTRAACNASVIPASAPNSTIRASGQPPAACRAAENTSTAGRHPTSRPDRSTTTGLARASSFVRVLPTRGAVDRDRGPDSESSVWSSTCRDSTCTVPPTSTTMICAASAGTYLNDTFAAAHRATCPLSLRRIV